MGPQFLADFEALKIETADSPEQLEKMWRARDDLQHLCDRLAQARFSFHAAEDWTPRPFTPHVPPAASRARRDYDERWRRPVARIADRELMALFDELFPDFEDDQASADPLGEEIEGWKNAAQNDAGSLEYALSCLADQRANDEHGDFDWVDEAERSWDRLMKFVGLDLQGAFWRRSAVPHILFPSHVSKQYGQKRASIYRRLQNAAQAFTFGAPLASLAMQRAVLEELLKSHWGAEKGIRDANLSHQQDIRASRLKRLANEALHGDPETRSSEQLERSIVQNFLLLRELIEATPGG